MTDDKWEELVELAKRNFRNVELRTEDLVTDTPEGPQVQGSQDILEFDRGSGERFRLIRENRPLVLEKKMHYSHRQGDTARTEYKLSDTELSHRLRVFKESDIDDWEEVTLDKLGF